MTAGAAAEEVVTMMKAEQAIMVETGGILLGKKGGKCGAGSKNGFGGTSGVGSAGAAVGVELPLDQS
jgi:hypothetical protein